MPRAVCALAMTLRFTEVRCAAAHMGAALQGIFVGQGPRALPGSAGKLGSGRCGERTERCRWQRKRSERVAAVKILSVRRKAAQKFWAPQQGHRPLRSVARGTAQRRIPQSRLRRASPPLGKGAKGDGGRIATASVRTGFAMTVFCKKCGGAGRCRHRPLRMGCKGCGEESPSHGFAVPAPFRQGGRGDGGCGLPRAVCALASQ